jgi:MOSC domain-containing protein YiiM
MTMARVKRSSPVRTEIEVLHCYISAGHNYFGHHGKPAGQHPMVEVDAIECVTGRGIRGDRFFDYKDNYKGQITFFADEVFRELEATFGVCDRNAGAFRRNVITRNVDLNALIGVEFEVQGVRFVGTGECKPCYWMDQAFHPGAEAALLGRGGLRAKILTNGTLRPRALLASSSPRSSL